MWYNLQNDVERQSFMEASMRLINDRTGMVELTNKKPRSMRANSYLHVILSYFALQIGEKLEDVKTLYYKQECNRDIFIRYKFDRILGRERMCIRSTRDLTTDEMNLSIERFRNFASQRAGIYLPSGNEHYALMKMNHDVNNSKQHL